VTAPDAIARRVDDASAWVAADHPEPRRWVRQLEATHLEEIDRALEGARARPQAAAASSRVRSSDRPPPNAKGPVDPAALSQTPSEACSEPSSLAATRDLLRHCAHDLEHGPGFAVLAGFPVRRYGDDERRLAFRALLGQLGAIAPQTRDGATLIDVIDRERPYDHTSRGYHSNRLLPFHTDGAHCVALLCLERAYRGGESVIVSAASASNAVLAERPDLWQVLARGFHHHRRGEQGPDESPLSPEPIPVWSFRGGLLQCMYNRNPIEWAEREGVVLSDLQREALDYLDAVLARPELQLAMELEPGDVQILNNFTILHSRTAYEDRPPRRRHLLRAWLTLPESRRAGPTLLDLYVPAQRR
jgi:Taurine catabolism dioxygenase TauD, TfdA family